MSKTDHIIMPEDHMDELYNSSNPLVRFVHNRRLDLILGALPRDEKLKVLDAGCGEGHLVARMYEAENRHDYYGVDITDVAIQKAKKRCPLALFRISDLERLDFPDNFFDVV